MEAYPGVAESSAYFVFFNTKKNGYSEPIKRGQVWKFMHKLNQESIAYTKRYLGITDDELQAVAQRLNL